MKRKQTAFFIIFMSILITLCGCAEKSTVYHYTHTKLIDEFTLTKSVYSIDSLELYLSGLDGDYKLTCYDAEFQIIDADFETDYKNGVYTIKGAEAERISGIMLSGNIVRFRIRYLDSSQYAILCDYDATDVGWITQGDEEKYYTQEELEAQRTAAENYNKNQEQTFNQFEGLWTCTEDASKYLNFYYDENGNRKLIWCHLDGQGGYTEENINVDEINIVDGTFGPELMIIDGISWGARYDFGLSSDRKMILDRRLDREEIYLRESNIPEELSVNKEFFMNSLFFDEDRALGAAYAMQKIGAGVIVEAKKRIDDEHAYTITLVNDSGDEYTASFSDNGFVGNIMDQNGKLLYYGID